MINQEELKSVLKYFPDTGEFYSIKMQRYVGYKRSDNYIVTYVKDRPYLLHRLAWLYMTGKWPDGLIDHIDRDRTNNKWTNLRDVTSRKSMYNRDVNINNSSNITGVLFDKRRNRWRSRIGLKNLDKHIGYFENFDAAVIARRVAEIKYGFSKYNERSSSYKYLQNLGIEINTQDRL